MYITKAWGKKTFVIDARSRVPIKFSSFFGANICKKEKKRHVIWFFGLF